MDERDQIRRVSSHVKVELLVGKVRDSAIIIGVNMGKAYSDERKLLVEIFEKINIKTMSKEVLKKFYEIGSDSSCKGHSSYEGKKRYKKKVKIEEYKRR